MPTLRVHVPATTANLGPGFDVLGLALDLWNTVTVRPSPALRVSVAGEGASSLPADARNRVWQAFEAVFARVRAPIPTVAMHCENRIPLSSGLGSSAAAALAGAWAANVWLGEPLSQAELLALVTEMEGHPDNAAPALLGGLTAAGLDADGRPWARSLPMAEAWYTGELVVWYALPDVALSTEAARAALPKQVALADAVFNLSRAVLLLEAFRQGDPGLLAQGMDDRWHQPYRLPLIPGATEALRRAREAGAWAGALSGAGPGVVAFASPEATGVGEAMRQGFASRGIAARLWRLRPTPRGVWHEREGTVGRRQSVVGSR
ncbi:MAG: homoserine kinase [Chloroflexi bacterium]|nr:homoserine kinase [Chloroflexota bacterium]